MISAAPSAVRLTWVAPVVPATVSASGHIHVRWISMFTVYEGLKAAHPRNRPPQRGSKAPRSPAAVAGRVQAACCPCCNRRCWQCQSAGFTVHAWTPTKDPRWELRTPTQNPDLMARVSCGQAGAYCDSPEIEMQVLVAIQLLTRPRPLAVFHRDMALAQPDRCGWLVKQLRHSPEHPRAYRQLVQRHCRRLAAAHAANQRGISGIDRSASRSGIVWRDVLCTTEL